MLSGPTTPIARPLPPPLRRLAAPRRSALLVGLALLSAGCAGDESPTPVSPRVALASARTRWQGAGLSTYTWQVTRQCFCPPLYTVPIDMRVRDGRVVEIWRDPGHSVLEDRTLGITVDSLFTVIERALDAGYETVEVSYDPRLGYPAQFNLDKAGLADEELAGTTRLLCRAPGEDPPACDCPAGGDTLGYEFTALDTAGVEVARGCLGLVFTPYDQSTVHELVAGLRCLRVACGADTPLAFPGEFSVYGRVSTTGSIDLDLNREIRDNNIQLLGRFDAGAGEHGDFSGTWHWSTFVGSVAHGAFQARRLPAP